MQPLVSIIVPIFNVGKYIEKCAHSLMTQQYENIEFVFIDDASDDDSVSKLISVIKQYPSRKHSISLIRHEENKGLPAARNTGLINARGEYFFHCDSDDWVEKNMISDMVEVLSQNDADVVYADFYISYNQSNRYMSQPSVHNPSECIKLMLQGTMKYNVWNKLIKRSLYTENKILFPYGKGMGEDMTIVKLFAHAQKVVHIPKAYYHYMQINTNAFTKSYSPKHLDDVLYNAINLEEYLRQQGFGGNFNKEFNYFKLNLKLPFLITENKKMYALWRKWFPESNKYISNNPGFSNRIKILQYLAIWKMDGIIWIYNFLIMRMIYRLIYR